MRSRNPDGPWNPEKPVEVTPVEYERQVLDWLLSSESNAVDIRVNHWEKIAGASGEYQFDVVARFSKFGGAEFTVLVECKRYRKAVERDLVMVLDRKRTDVGAHKGMMFSTSDFQKGAIEFASQNGIALLTFRDGRAIYETKDYGPPIEPPPWADLPRFVAERLSIEGKRLHVHRVQNGDVQALDEFLADT